MNNGTNRSQRVYQRYRSHFHDFHTGLFKTVEGSGCPRWKLLQQKWYASKKVLFCDFFIVILRKFYGILHKITQLKCRVKLLSKIKSVSFQLKSHTNNPGNMVRLAYLILYKIMYKCVSYTLYYPPAWWYDMSLKIVKLNFITFYKSMKIFFKSHISVEHYYTAQ